MGTGIFNQSLNVGDLRSQGSLQATLRVLRPRPARPGHIGFLCKSILRMCRSELTSAESKGVRAGSPIPKEWLPTTLWSGCC